MSDYLDKNNYSNFGKRTTPPGLIKNQLKPFKNKNTGATINLYAGTQYDKNGISRSTVGFEGAGIKAGPGELNVYGGIGNAIELKAEYTLPVSKSDNFSFDAFAKADCVFSPKKKEFEIEYNSDTQSTTTQTSSVSFEVPGQVIQTGDAEHNLLPENTDSFIHTTEFTHRYNVNVPVNAKLKGDIFSSDLKASIGGKLTYTNDKGNFDAYVSGEAGIKTEFEQKTKYNQNCSATQNITPVSAEYNEDAYFEISAHKLDNGHTHVGYGANFESDEHIKIENNVNIGGFVTKTGIATPSLYCEIDGGLNYKVGKFKFGAEAGLKYCDKQFSPVFKAGISYVLGESPKIYNHGPRVLFRESPIDNRAIYQTSSYPKAELYGLTKAQMNNGVNGIAAGIGGKIPINNVGTDINLSAELVGTYVGGELSLSQTNPVVNDNWSLKSSVGVKGALSWTDKQVLSMNYLLAEKELTNNSTNVVEHWLLPNNNSDGNSPQPEYIITPPSNPQTIDEEYKVFCTNTKVGNASYINPFAELKIAYKQENWSVNASVEGGVVNTASTPTLSANSDGLNITSSEYKPCEHTLSIYNNKHLATSDFTEGNWTEHYEIHELYHNSVTTSNAQAEQYYEGDTQLTLGTTESEGTISLIPKFVPTLKLGFGGEYNIDKYNTLNGQISYDVIRKQPSAQLTYIRRIKL